jgi:hypothetical protein
LKLIRIGIQLILVALVVNATWHVFGAYSAHFKFRDAVQYAAQNRGQKSDEQLRDELMDVAAEDDVPITPSSLVVTHAGLATEVTAAYTRPIEVFPNHTYPWSFSFRVNTFTRQVPNSVK